MTSYFSKVNDIKYEGKGSDNQLAFKFYEENKLVAGKPMKDHLRFAISYWHSFCSGNSDPFGVDTRPMPYSMKSKQAFPIR